MTLFWFFFLTQEDTIKWVYNNSESAREDNQKIEQKTAAQENGDGFECKVEGGFKVARSNGEKKSLHKKIIAERSYRS